MSQKTKSSVPPRRGTRQRELVVGRFVECLIGQNRTKTGQGNAGRFRMISGEAALLSFSPFDILVYCTRVSAMPICSISQ